MQIERVGKLTEEIENMSDKEVVDKVESVLKEPDVTKIVILPNRHERRRDAALARKKRKE